MVKVLVSLDSDIDSVCTNLVGSMPQDVGLILYPTFQVLVQRQLVFITRLYLDTSAHIIANCIDSRVSSERKCSKQMQIHLVLPIST